MEGTGLKGVWGALPARRTLVRLKSKFVLRMELTREENGPLLGVEVDAPNGLMGTCIFFAGECIGVLGVLHGAGGYLSAKHD